MRILISEAAEIRTGYQVRQGLHTTPDGTHLVVQAKDIGDDHMLVLEHLERFSPADGHAPYLIRNGDVLFLSRGRKLFATPVEGIRSSQAVVPLYYFFVLSPNRAIIDPAFLAWTLNQTDTQEHIARLVRGTTIPFVTKQAFASIELALPPLRTQMAIGELHTLACRERQLSRQLDHQRSELVQVACEALRNQQEIN